MHCGFMAAESQYTAVHVRLARLTRPAGAQINHDIVVNITSIANTLILAFSFSLAKPLPVELISVTHTPGVG
jgi:hypothetical protein